jgi:hypothetical protein
MAKWWSGLTVLSKENDSIISSLCMATVVVPQLLATWIPMRTQRFMQDGARPHTVNVVPDCLHGTFGNKLMSYLFTQHHVWSHVGPSRGSIINPCDFLRFGVLEGETVSEETRNDGGTEGITHPTVAHNFCRYVTKWSQVSVFGWKRSWGQNVGRLEHGVHYKQFSTFLYCSGCVKR